LLDPSEIVSLFSDKDYGSIAINDYGTSIKKEEYWMKYAIEKYDLKKSYSAI